MSQHLSDKAALGLRSHAPPHEASTPFIADLQTMMRNL